MFNSRKMTNHLDSGGEAATGFYRFPVLGGAEAERCQAWPRPSTLYFPTYGNRSITYIDGEAFIRPKSVFRQSKAITGHNSLQKNRTMFAVFFLAATILASVPARSQSTLPDSPSVSRFRQSYQPITGKERLKWLVRSSVGPQTLFVGLFSAAISTAENTPKEYGPSWEGYGKRYGMRLTGNTTSNAMEAGFGSIWGEDPRYFPTEGEPFKKRAKNVIAMAFLVHNHDGKVVPAYARYIAVPGSSFLSNTWRADGEATNSDALQRVVWGFLGDIGGNAFAEFWPDIHKRLLHNKF